VRATLLFLKKGQSMAVSRPTEPIDVTFKLQGTDYRATLTRGDIVHVGIHKALPAELTVGHRLTFATANGHEVFADNFLGDLADHFGTTELVTIAQPIAAKPGPWRNVGFDHLAITVQDRQAARDFFRDVLQLQVMRDDPHLTVMASGHTALFLFDAGQEAPLSTGLPSSWHHIGFVVDDLEAAYAHLQAHKQWLSSDFTLLDRDERWSLYFFYKNGDVTFMIQFSQVKEAWRGYHNPGDAKFAAFLYDYASRPYGVQFE
jgi:catechol 2,3-dioxygenase-like lactoylglutathione lyase family enzyme